MSANPYDLVPRVHRHPDLGWRWNVGHVCSYACGAGGCDGAGWRLTRRGAVRAARRYLRSLERSERRTAGGWERVQFEETDR